MAQQMSLKGRAFTASSVAPRASTRCVAVRASREAQVSLVDRVAPSMLAGLVALSAGFSTFDATFAPPARADEEELSPYQKRQAELERRRELLREAREKAAARAAGETYTPPEPAAAPAPAAPAPAAPSLTNSLQSYNAATQNRPSIPTPAPESEAPKWGGFSFSKPAEPEAPAAPAAAEPAKKESSSDTGSMFSSDMWNTPIKPKAAEPAPAAVTPAPAPFKAAPAPAPKAPEPVKKLEVKKAEVKKPEVAKPGKRRGPLPLWFAETLVLGFFVGIFLAVTKYSKESGEVLKVVWAKVVEAYNALEKLINKPKTA